MPVIACKDTHNYLFIQTFASEKDNSSLDSDIFRGNRHFSFDYR